MSGSAADEARCERLHQRVSVPFGGRAILIVRQVWGRDPDERWCMRGKYKPEGPSSFIFSLISHEWVRYYPEDDED